MIYNFEYTKEEKIKEILYTLVKILEKRNVINNNEVDTQYKMILKNYNKQNNETFIKNQNSNYRIKFLLEKKILKISEYEKFFTDNINDKKIIILNIFNAKIYNSIKKYSEEIEIFRNVELIYNILDNNLVSDYMVLSNEQSKKFMQDYNINEKNKYREIPKIFDTDIICRYLNVKPGDLLKIISINELSGYGVNYRIVIKGKLFE